MTTFECPACGEAVTSEASAGAAVPCPRCGREVAVPPGTSDHLPAEGISHASPTVPPPVRLEYAAATSQPASQGLAIASLVCGIVGSLGAYVGVVGVVGLGGLVLGLSESFFSGFINTDYKDVFAFSILVLVLIFKPTGLLGVPEVEKV